MVIWLRTVPSGCFASGSYSKLQLWGLPSAGMRKSLATPSDRQSAGMTVRFMTACCSELIGLLANFARTLPNSSIIDDHGRQPCRVEL